MFRIIPFLLIAILHHANGSLATEISQSCKDLKKDINQLEETYSFENFKKTPLSFSLLDPRSAFWHPAGTPGMLVTVPALYSGKYLSESIENLGLDKNIAEKLGAAVSVSLLIPAAPIGYAVNLSVIPPLTGYLLIDYAKNRYKISKLNHEYKEKCS